MKKKRETKLLAFVFLACLTITLFKLTQARRRAHVPEITISMHGFPATACFSPINDQLVLASGHWIALTKLRDTKLKLLKMPSWIESSEISWSIDGKKLFHSKLGNLRWSRIDDSQWHNFSGWQSDPQCWTDYNTAVISLTGNYGVGYKALNNETERVWLTDLKSGKCLWNKDFRQSKGSYIQVRAIGILQNEKRAVIITTTSFNDARKGTPTKLILCNLRNGKLEKTFILQPDWLQSNPKSQLGYPKKNLISIVFSPDGTLMAAYGVSQVFLYSTLNGDLIAKLPQASVNQNHYLAAKQVMPLKISPNGRLLAVSYGGAVEVWSIPQKKLLQLFFPGSQDLSFSYDSKRLASLLPNGVAIWEVGSL